MIDIIRNPRFIAANTIAALTFAATAGCASEKSPEDRIDASYDASFVSDPDTACYTGVIDHASIQEDLPGEIDKRPWLEVDSLSTDQIETAAEDITTILAAIYEMSSASEGSSTPNSVQQNGTYKFCVKDGEIKAGDPLYFNTTNK